MITLVAALDDILYRTNKEEGGTTMKCRTSAAGMLLLMGLLLSFVPFGTQASSAQMSTGPSRPDIAESPQLETPSDTVLLSADSYNLETVGQVGGATYGLFVQGSYAYIGLGPRLVTLDISDPSSPTLVGQTSPLPDFVRGVYVSGDYAYVANEESGLCIVDVSNPATPEDVGAYDTPGWAKEVTVADGYAYIADDLHGLQVIDVSDPTNPSWVSSYTIQHRVNGVAVSGNYAYVAGGPNWNGSQYVGDGLHVLDISNPEDLWEVGFFPASYSAEHVVVAGNLAYITESLSENGQMIGGGLRVLDISNPAAPTAIGFYDTSDDPEYSMIGNVFLSDHHAYVIHGHRLLILDISEPSAPFESMFEY